MISERRSEPLNVKKVHWEVWLGRVYKLAELKALISDQLKLDGAVASSPADYLLWDPILEKGPGKLADGDIQQLTEKGFFPYAGIVEETSEERRQDYERNLRGVGS